jgi:peptidyl-dipeptidase A
MMKDHYNQVRICPYRGVNLYSDGSNVTTFHAYCDLRLEPDLAKIMERSRNEEELRYVWSEYREKIGPPIRNTFMRYVDLSNQAAQLHGFRDAGDQMRELYEDPDFFFTVQDLWQQVGGLYKQLFTFVRSGLYRHYGPRVLRRDGPIPAHLLGNMYGQNWRNILDIIKPQNEMPDITGEMIKQGYTPMKIFQVAEEFFTSLGLPPMSPEFWRNSILQKPNDVYTQCSASAWDFCNLLDFRIKQCTQISLEDFINSHHEMTHIHVSYSLFIISCLITFCLLPSFLSTTCSTPLNHLFIANLQIRLSTKL